MNRKCEIYAFLPRLSSMLGHIFHYHVSVQEATRLIDWNYAAFVPEKIRLSLPKGWEPSLANDLSDRPKQLPEKLKILFKSIVRFRKVFRSIERKDQAVVFLEHFEFIHLTAILFALFFLKPRFQFWILYRYELENRPFKAFLNRLFLGRMKQKLHLKCLTDSELLANSLSKDLGTAFHVVPIPHTVSRIAKEKKVAVPFYFWWPGGLIREDKGLLEIQKLVPHLNDLPDLFLAVAEKAKEVLPCSERILFVPTELSREDYLNWMERANLVLLPYSLDYRYRTSGIFVEAVSLGAIPVVTKGTWMAYELARFDLSELIFDWKEPKLLNRLFQLIGNEEVRKKLELMSDHYQKFHSIEGFSTAFAGLVSPFGENHQ